MRCDAATAVTRGAPRAARDDLAPIDHAGRWGTHPRVSSRSRGSRTRRISCAEVWYDRGHHAMQAWVTKRRRSRARSHGDELDTGDRRGVEMGSWSLRHLSRLASCSAAFARCQLGSSRWPRRDSRERPRFAGHRRGLPFAFQVHRMMEWVITSPPPERHSRGPPRPRAWARRAAAPFRCVASRYDHPLPRLRARRPAHAALVQRRGLVPTRPTSPCTSGEGAARSHGRERR